MTRLKHNIPTCFKQHVVAKHAHHTEQEGEATRRQMTASSWALEDAIRGRVLVVAGDEGDKDDDAKPRQERRQDGNNSTPQTHRPGSL